MEKVRFYNLPTKTLSAKAIKDWVVKLANHYEVQIDNFAVNFINKEQMLEMNQKHLNHDTHTDILTFDYGNHHVIKCGAICIRVHVFPKRGRKRSNN